jgi:hypothetical protein
MSSLFPNGTKYAISTALAAAVPITAVTNATPAVASAATPPADGAIAVIASGWPGLNNRIARAANPDANSFELEGIDTSSVVRFPAGEGLGQFQVVSGWTPIDQVTAPAMSGGDQQYFTFQYTEDEDGEQQQKPTTKNPRVLTLTMDYDPEKPWYEALIAADRAKVPVVLRAAMPNGYTMYYLANPSFNEVPTSNLNQNMQNVATFSLIKAPARYKAVA